MRLAIVHSIYSSRSPSGENRVVEAEMSALADAGHDVELMAIETDEAEQEFLHRSRAAARVMTGVGTSPLARLRDFAPDVVHVHNLFPNFGRRWVRRVPVPLVHTLHNFRPWCVNAFLFRDGQVCTRCPDGHAWDGVRYGCYRGSRAASLPLAVANRGGPTNDPLLSRADRLVVLSSHQASLLEADGIDPRRVVRGANFLPERLTPPDRPNDGSGAWLVIGRLTPEKGIASLVERWPAGEPLDVVGDGPERERIEQTAPPGVRVIGAVSRDEVMALMSSAAGLVLPSRWFEMDAPLTYLEAIACGLPVVTFEPTAAVEDVRDHGTGAVAEFTTDGIVGALQRVRVDRAAISRRSRSRFLERHTEAEFVRRTEKVYADLLAEQSGGGW